MGQTELEVAPGQGFHRHIAAEDQHARAAIRVAAGHRLDDDVDVAQLRFPCRTDHPHRTRALDEALAACHDSLQQGQYALSDEVRQRDVERKAHQVLAAHEAIVGIVGAGKHEVRADEVGHEPRRLFEPFKSDITFGTSRYGHGAAGLARPRSGGRREVWIDCIHGRQNSTRA